MFLSKLVLTIVMADETIQVPGAYTGDLVLEAVANRPPHMGSVFLGKYATVDLILGKKLDSQKFYDN